MDFIFKTVCKRCAITEAAPSYRKMKEEMKNKEEEKDENPDIISNELQRLLFVSGT